jgi:hypothetical protein
VIEEKPSQNDEQDNKENTEGNVPPAEVRSITPPSELIVPPEQASGNTATETPQAPPEQAEEAIEEAMKPFERRMLIATWVGIAIGVITGLVFIGQFWQMKKQTKILGQQVEDATSDTITARRHARQQLGAMQDQVKAIQRQMRQDQRAWLDIQFDAISWAENQTIQVRMTLTNKGKTPAKRVSGRAYVEKILINQKLEFGKYEQQFGSGFLAPNIPISNWGFQSAHKHVPLPMSKTDVADLNEGRAIAVVHGDITYLDIFGIEHWTKFCTYNAAFRFITTTPVQNTAPPCTNYNDADNN